MERLTIKNPNGEYALKLDEPETETEARKQLMQKFKLACNKLGKFEDREEENTEFEKSTNFEPGEKALYNLWECKNFPHRQVICEVEIEKKIKEDAYSVRIEQVLTDTASGNGYYEYLAKNHLTTNASAKYLFKPDKSGVQR